MVRPPASAGGLLVKELVVLEQVLEYLHNHFAVEAYSGEFAIQDGVLTGVPMKSGQYYWLRGAVYSSGLHKEGEPLQDETFSGTVELLAIPHAVTEIAAEVEAWQAKHGDAASGPYASESFGGYSYNIATGGADGQARGWQVVFSGRLSPWRKVG